MIDQQPPSIGESLIRLVRQSLQSDRSALAEGVEIYTSFGVVRGRISRAMIQGEAKTPSSADSLHLHTPHVIEVEEVTVEHYANHLAAAHYDRLFISTADVRSFALVQFNSAAY